MPYDKEHLDEQNQDVLERNIKGSQEVIEERKKREAEGDTNPPPSDENDPSVPVDQPHKPAGGTTGGFQNPGQGVPD